MQAIRLLPGIALASALLAAGGAAQAATIVNIAAFDAATAGNAPAATSLTLGPGSYQVSWIGKAQGGAYDGWTYQLGNPTVREAITVSLNGQGMIVDKYDGTSSYYKGYANATAALAAFASGPYAVAHETYSQGSAPSFASTGAGPFTLNLGSTTQLSFSVPDYLWFDNSGGVSLSIAAVPEPESMALMMGGLGIVVLMARRRFTRES